MANLSPIEARYLDKVQDTQTALWSALIAAEAILLAVAPLLAVVVPPPVRVFSVLLIVMSLLGTSLLVWNFLSTRNLFYKIGQKVSERRPPSGDDIPDAGKLHRQVRMRERLAILLVLLQFLLVMALAVLEGYQ